MTVATRTYQGGCLCGAVRYTATGEPINMRVCHCRLCQRAIGAAFNARLLFHVGDVAWSGDPVSVRSSPDLERVFCVACGTSLASRRPAAGVIGITSGSLDDPTLFAPSSHIFVASKQPWMVIADGLVQYSEAPPAS